MELTDIPNVVNWLDQFELPDVYVAEHMLRRIRYVNFEEFETWLHKSVNGLLDEIVMKDGKVAVAIFPVAKPNIHAFNKDKEHKPPNDSAGRIAHSLKNIERDLPEYVEMTPRLDSMRKRKVKHIVYVDDFVGTGNRFTKFWNSSVPTSIKSWCSLGWCKIWIICFAAHQSGLNKIIHRIRPLSHDQIRVNLTINNTFFLQNKNMRAVLQKYGKPLGDPREVLGYGGLASPIIFQHGCPNNVPLIFWLSPIRRRQIKWNPLFPDRSVLAEVYPLFEEDWALAALPEELWMAKHYHLAVTIMGQLSKYNTNHQILLVIGLLLKGYGIDKIKNNMVLTADEFDTLINQLKEGGLVDQNFAVTRFGRDIIARIAKSSKKDVTINSEGNFFPSSFLGFRRET